MKDTLSGVQVLDFSTLLPGPLASLLLAEAGAEVTKIEPPGGEELRRYPPFHEDGVSACYRLLNKGKSIREIDLKSPDAMAELTPLIREADVLIEQFRPGVMARLGLDYDTICEIKPDIIYCSITGFGQAGPRALKAGHDMTYMAESGLLSLTQGPHGRPIVPPVLTADIAGGTYPAALRIALALFRRERSGQGAYLDISMTDNLLPFAWWSIAIRSATGKTPGPGDWTLNGGSPRYGIYPTKDGRAVAVGALEQKFWIALCDAVSLPEELRDDRKDPDATALALAECLAGRDAEDWRPIFEQADCCCSVIDAMGDVLDAMPNHDLFQGFML